MALTQLYSHLQTGVVTYSSRAKYFAETGKPAPAWDSSSPVKTWVDTLAVNVVDKESEIQYLGIKYDDNGNPSLEDGTRTCKTTKFYLFPEVAATVNFLPELLQPLASMTQLQAKMSSRQRPVPLTLKPGEKVVLAPGIGMIPVIDDGIGTQTGTGAFPDRALYLLEAIAKSLGVK